MRNREFLTALEELARSAEDVYIVEDGDQLHEGIVRRVVYAEDIACLLVRIKFTECLAKTARVTCASLSMTQARALKRVWRGAKEKRPIGKRTGAVLTRLGLWEEGVGEKMILTELGHATLMYWEIVEDEIDI